MAFLGRVRAIRTRTSNSFLAEGIYQLVLESQLTRRIVNLLFTITDGVWSQSACDSEAGARGSVARVWRALHPVALPREVALELPAPAR